MKTKEDTARAFLSDRLAYWYKLAWDDYKVKGAFKSFTVDGTTAIIEWSENGKDNSLRIPYWEDYTPKQLYHIWMEEA